jgi:hypothetical protein
VEKRRVERLGGVLPDVFRDALGVASGPNIDDVRIAGYGLPKGLEERLREEATLNENVKVGVPAVGFREPLNFAKGDPAGYAGEPLWRTSQPLEGGVQAVEGIGQWLTRGAEGEGQKADFRLDGASDDSTSDSTGAVLSTGETESVVTAGTGETKPVRVRLVLEHVDTVATFGEGVDTVLRLSGAV